jgi:hypothetical protein
MWLACPCCRTYTEAQQKRAATTLKCQKCGLQIFVPELEQPIPNANSPPIGNDKWVHCRIVEGVTRQQMQLRSQRQFEMKRGWMRGKRWNIWFADPRLGVMHLRRVDGLWIWKTERNVHLSFEDIEDGTRVIVRCSDGKAWLQFSLLFGSFGLQQVFGLQSREC